MFKHTTKSMIAAFALIMTLGAAANANASTPVLLGNSASMSVLSTATAMPGDDWFVSFGGGSHDQVALGFGWGFGFHDHCHSHTRIVRYRRPVVHRRFVVEKRVRPFRRGGRRIVIR